nr:hypothetical protein [Tanacetum cinerariifolium]
KKEAKGNSHVESLTGYRNLSAEFKDFFDNSINEDNTNGTLVLTVGQISPNNTDTFTAAGPSNAVASPTHGKSSYDIGAEADFNNLETSITNTDGDAAFKGKKPEFERRKPESEVHVSPSSSAQTKKHDDKTKREAKGKSPVESSTRYRNLSAEFDDFFDNSINEVNAADSPVPAVGQISTNSTNTFSAVGPSNTDADFTNLETTITVSPIPTIRVHKDHPVTQIIGDLSLATQTRSVKRVAKDQGRLSQINNDNFHTCMFACFLSQKEPKKVHQALKDPSWIKAMQEELLQFKMHKVWVLVDLPNRKRVIGGGLVDQEDGIDYEEVFAPVARIKAIRLFLAYAPFMGFMVYQMDVKSAFLYGTIEEE